MKADHPSKTDLLTCCPACGAGGKDWRVVERAVEQEFRGESFHLPASVQACSVCHFEALRDSAADALVHGTWAAYRQRHGLLEPREILHFRNELGMSQNAFADYLGTGVASVKRWEKGLVQDKAMDELIRAKMKLHRLQLRLLPQFDLAVDGFTMTFGISIPMSLSAPLPAFFACESSYDRLQTRAGFTSARIPSSNLKLPTDAFISAA